MAFSSTLTLARQPSAANRARPAWPQSPPPNVAALRFALPHAASAEIHVLDLSGRRVRTLTSGELAAGEHACAWDGRNEDGAPCPAGSYVLRLETNGAVLTSRIVALG